VRITEAFPPSIPIPPLLGPFEAWFEDQTEGTLGWCDLQPIRLDDYWIENGSALAEQFALFIHLPDGGRIGLWKNADLEAFPVVLLGSEGEQSVLAPDFPTFLWMWGSGALDRHPELVPDAEYLEEEGLIDARPALLDWLRQQNMRVDDPAEPKSDSLRTFFNNWQEQQFEQWERSESLQEIGRLLSTYAPAQMEDWQSVSLTAVLGNQGLRVTRSPLNDSEGAEALFQLEQLRDEMARAMPQRGLWFSAEVKWFKTFGTTIRAEYLAIPQGLDDSGVQDALTRFPRSSFWMPDRS